MIHHSIIIIVLTYTPTHLHSHSLTPKVIDAVPLTPPLKQELDALTGNGLLIDAVIATHPFHTLAFESFYTSYNEVLLMVFITTCYAIRYYSVVMILLVMILIGTIV